MGDTKIQWHPGFVAAMNLEFEDNRDTLIFEKEYNLNTGPLEIDLLVIKKEPGVLLVNDIGKLFRGRNIMEYSVLEVRNCLQITAASLWQFLLYFRAFA